MEQIVTAFAVIGTLIKDYTYAVEDGCIQNHLQEPHKRGKNWLAFVTANRASPGGLDREFWKHGSRDWYKAPRAIRPGDVIEFGGDYYTGRGGKRPDRSYVLVLRTEDTYLVGVVISDAAPSAKRIAEQRSTYGVAGVA